MQRLECKGAGGVLDEDGSGELLAQLPFEARFEAGEEVIEARPP